MYKQGDVVSKSRLNGRASRLLQMGVIKEIRPEDEPSLNGETKPA
jgi:hypothetical protein